METFPETFCGFFPPCLMAIGYDNNGLMDVS